MARTEDGRSSAPALPTGQFLRWAWRQLTSMGTALLLLLLLAVGAIPGSLIPQQGVDALAVVNFKDAHPQLTPVYDWLGLFSVYTSVWFSAIYLLLLVSLVGCIVPRSLTYARALRARPPRTPRNLERLPSSKHFDSDESVDDVLDRAYSLLKSRRFRVDRDAEAGGGSVRAQKGYLREAGNLVFHIAVVVVLVGVAAGAMLGYRGGAIVTEGSGFSNTLTQYDDFSSGSLFDSTSLPPFSLQLDRMRTQFQLTGPQRGAPKEFEATGTYTPEPGAAEQSFDIQVNHPLKIAGTSVFLVGQGYAPHLTIRDGNGDLVLSEAVPFLPADGTYTSNGVIKVPDARPSQLAFQGFFLPTAVQGAAGVPVSIFPGPLNPYVGLFVYTGDLGMDSGTPQSVYLLDKANLDQLIADDGKALRIELTPGSTTRLPDGLGSITFDGVDRFARFQISASPGATVPLIGVICAVLGLIASLYIRPRRAWVRARDIGGRTVVEVAGLDRVSGGDLASDLDEFCAQLRKDTSAEETPA